MVQPIQGTEAFRSVTAKGDAIVGFSAPWCGYCRRLFPIMQKLSDEIAVPVYGINCDEDKELAAEFEIDTIPNILFFKDGKRVDSMIGDGSVGYAELKAFIEKNQSK